MATFAPFTAYIKVVPHRGQDTSTAFVRKSSRLDYVRSLESIAKYTYDGLAGVSGVTLANPGGGQFYTEGQFGSIAKGTAIKPQFGNSPALLTIEGFYSIESEPAATYPDKMIICNNSWQTGPAAGHDYAVNPNAAVASEVAALKVAIDAVLATIPDDSPVAPVLFRLVYKGITWGDRGYHFP